jgi:hypothetical protein
VDCFLFLVKELGFWTNPSYWVSVLDVVGFLYVYCIVNNVTQCMNIIYAGFHGLGFQVKNLYVMLAFAIVSFLFFSEYQFAVDIVQG